MMNSSLSMMTYIGLDGSMATSPSLFETAKSVYLRSKLPVRLLLENGSEDFTNKPSAASMSWLVKLMQTDAAASIISMLSPNLTRGHGLNEYYKIIEGLLSTYIISDSYGPLVSVPNTSIYVQIDVTKLSIQLIIKLRQILIKHYKAMDSFVLW